MTKKRKFLIILYIIIMAGLLVAIYTVPKVTGALTPTITLEYGSLRVTDDVSLYFGRNETLYLTGQTGVISYYVSQDTQVRKGAKVLTISGSGTSSETPNEKLAAIRDRIGVAAVTSSDFTVAENGCISYFADGLESAFSPENLGNLSYSDIRDLNVEVVNLTRERADRGEPVYKVCDVKEWYMTCWIKPGDITKYEIGSNVQVELPKATIPAKVMSLEDEGDMWQLLLSTDRYYEDYTKIRVTDATIIAYEYNGIIIPNASIKSEDGQIGVYVRNMSGEYSFTPIKIMTSDGDNSIVYPNTYTDDSGETVSTVNIYDEILK